MTQQGKPVAYHSESFFDTIQRYNTFHKETYAIVQALKHWKHYLLGKETIIHSDHQPLQHLHSQSRLEDHRMVKWMGVFAAVSHCHQVQEGEHKQSGRLLE